MELEERTIEQLPDIKIQPEPGRHLFLPKYADSSRDFASG